MIAFCASQPRFAILPVDPIPRPIYEFLQSQELEPSLLYGFTFRNLESINFHKLRTKRTIELGLAEFMFCFGAMLGVVFNNKTDHHKQEETRK